MYVEDENCRPRLLVGVVHNSECPCSHPDSGCVFEGRAPDQSANHAQEGNGPGTGTSYRGLDEQNPTSFCCAVVLL